MERFHPLFGVRLVRRPALLCLLPLLRPALAPSPRAFSAALVQELGLLLLLLFAAFLLWRGSGWQLSSRRLVCLFRAGGLQASAALFLPALSWAALCRPWYLRPFRAVRLELAFADGSRFSLLLSPSAASSLLDALFPPLPAARVCTPPLPHRLRLALLGCDVPAFWFLVSVTLRRLSRFAGAMLPLHTPGESVLFLTGLLSRWLPAGLSLFAAAVALPSLCSFLAGLARVSRFSLRGSGSTLEVSLGFLSPTVFRLALQRDTVVELRTTPLSFLLGGESLWLCAGGRSFGPLLFCPFGRPPVLPSFLGGVSFARPRPAADKGRSLWAFFASPLACVCLFVFLVWRLRELFSLLLWLWLFTAQLLLFFLLFSLWGYRCDVLQYASNLHVVFHHTRRLTRSRVFLFSPPSARCSQSPFARRKGRCTLVLTLPGRRRFRLKSQPFSAAVSLFVSQKEL